MQSLLIAVVVPVYNHSLTVGAVVRGASQFFQVIAVDDGSTDATPAALAAEKDIERVTLPANRGKAAALSAGFARARQLGFTHVITLDADGQHPVQAIPAFARAAHKDPTSIVIGVRDFKAARAPWLRRTSNSLSSFCFRLETGLSFGDTQCGFRVYPLATIEGLQVKAERYAYELELLVRATWAGIPIAPCPVLADYTAPTSRLSHFHPVYDFARAAQVHLRLMAERILARHRVTRFGRRRV